MSDDGGGVADNQIVVTAGRIAQLEKLFAKTWQRPPSRTSVAIHLSARDVAAYGELKN